MFAMDDKRDLDKITEEYFVCPGCNKVIPYDEIHQYRKKTPKELMGMDLLEFFVNYPTFTTL